MKAEHAHTAARDTETSEERRAEIEIAAVAEALIQNETRNMKAERKTEKEKIERVGTAAQKSSVLLELPRLCARLCYEKASASRDREESAHIVMI